MSRPLVLILCTGNSCRSHMAEGICAARRAISSRWRARVLGRGATCIRSPFARWREIGIDISAHTSKHMNDFLDRDVRTVITVCGNADQACPMFPGQVNRYHWGFDDPAHATGGEDEQMAVFRRVRDEIVRVFEAYAAGLREGRTA